MIYYCAAMHCEAKPLIDRYKMKKLIRIKQFQVFEGRGERLVITGVGGVPACCGVSCLLNAFPPGEDDFSLATV